MPLFFMTIEVDGVELNVSWAADQLVGIKNQMTPEPAEMPDFSGMKKAELVEYLSPDGSSVDTALTKAELIKLAEALYATRS